MKTRTLTLESKATLCFAMCIVANWLVELLSR